MPAKIGLALSGGGSKGAFTVGVLQVIDQVLDAQPYPVISGTSTGALIGTLLATNQFARLVEIYSTVETSDIVNPHHAFIATVFGPEAVLFAQAILGGRAIFDSRALRQTIEQNLNFTKLKQSRTLLIYNTVNLQSGELETFSNKDYPKEILVDALLASANMPVLTDPVPIANGTVPPPQFVNGGVREFLPLRAVFESGVELDHIIAISTAPLSPQLTPGRLDDILGILKRTIDLLNSEIAHDDYLGAQLFNGILQMVENAEAAGVPRSALLRDVPEEVRTRLEGKRAVPVTFIGPDSHLDMDSLTFEPAEMKKAMRLGVKIAKKIVPTIEKVLP